VVSPTISNTTNLCGGTFKVLRYVPVQCTDARYGAEFIVIAVIMSL